jgi:galactose mutarotase-like enzyme
MLTIQNNHLQVSIQEKGAELQSIFHKIFNIEYLWSGDPQFWGKKSPALFPIVGTLKNNSYTYQDKAYELSRHGFARDKVFSVTAQTDESVTLSIESDDSTLAVYPFHFRFNIIYTLHQDKLTVTYEVENTGPSEMYFSVGGHPAFKLPLIGGTVYEDYELEFNKTETTGRWPLSKEGLIEKKPLPLLQNTNILPLSKALFNHDAIVLKHLQSDSVRLVSSRTQHGLRFTFIGFPYLGLWAAPGADFICIEPWCGIADNVDASSNWPDKEGLNQLAVGKMFEASWQVSFF